MPWIPTSANPLIVFGILIAAAPLPLPAQSPAGNSFSISPGDVTEAAIDNSGPTRLKVTLTPEKSEALSTFTGVNLNKQISIIVCGKVRSEPFLRERLAGPTTEIYVTSPEDALATVKALLTAKLPFDRLHKWTDTAGQTHYAEKPPAESSAPRLAPKPLAANQDKSLFHELQGSWVVTNATMNGKPSRDPALLQGNWKFQGNELLLQSPQKGTARFSLTLDEKAVPKAFQLTGIEPAAERPGWMLYAREGTALRIAFYDNLEGRPDSFEPGGPRSKPELVVLILTPKK